MSHHKKAVEFSAVFEYDPEQFPDHTDEDFEQMAFETIMQNPEVLQGEVYVPEE